MMGAHVEQNTGALCPLGTTTEVARNRLACTQLPCGSGRGPLKGSLYREVRSSLVLPYGLTRPSHTEVSSLRGYFPVQNTSKPQAIALLTIVWSRNLKLDFSRKLGWTEWTQSPLDTLSLCTKG